jgi:hypothetical protein
VSHACFSYFPKERYSLDFRDVDLTFFIATVDLWSEDGMREMNLVLNTSNTERNAHITPRRRRRTNSAMTVSSPDTPDFAAGVNIAPISEGQASDSQCYEEPEVRVECPIL